MSGTVRLTTAQALVRFLQVQWTERDGHRRRAVPAMFGIFGHGNVCSLSEALAAPDVELPFHQPKHEQAMVHTAIGYAKACRRLATLACTTSIGPGATNLVTGAATATTNRLPVLLLPADTFAGCEQGPVLQQLQHPSYGDWSVNECLRPVSRFFDRIARPEQLLAVLPAAMRVLFDPVDTGAVTVALHQDVLGEAHDFPVSFLAPRTWHVARRPAEPHAVRRAAGRLRCARRPLLIAGGGVRHSGAEDALAAFAERHRVPVAETSAGKGAYTGDLLVGGIGVNGTRPANDLAGVADLVVCVGTRLSDFTTASRTLFRADPVAFVAVNVDAGDAHALGAEAVVADAREGLSALSEAVGSWSTAPAFDQARTTATKAWRATLEDELLAEHGDGLGQGQAIRVINRACGAGDWIVAAAGGPPGDLLKLWEVPPGGFTHIEFAFSCMGHELPAALGIRLAEPDCGAVIALIGDGTYLMAPTELVTAVQDDLDVTVVVLVNGGYQSIHGLQRRTVGRSLGNEFRRASDGGELAIDYAANARSLGCAAWDVDSAEGLAAALAATRQHHGPALIACRVDWKRPVPDSGAWWDLGVARASPDPRVRELAEAQAAGAAGRRWLA